MWWGSITEVYNRKNGELLFRVMSDEVEDVIKAFKKYFKNFNSWEEVEVYLKNKNSHLPLTYSYIVHANCYEFIGFDDEILSIFNEEDSDTYDYDNLVANHIYCECPSALLDCEEFKAQEEIARINLGKTYADYITTFLISNYLTELLIDEGELVVELDDCNVWLFDSSVTDLKEQLKYILEV